MFETAIRSGELVNLQLDDVDLIARVITIRRGKGADAAGSSRSAVPRPRRSCATSMNVNSIRTPPPRTCGRAAAVSNSAQKD